MSEIVLYLFYSNSVHSISIDVALTLSITNLFFFKFGDIRCVNNSDKFDVEYRSSYIDGMEGTDLRYIYYLVPWVGSGEQRVSQR